ncbi:MAG: prepilin peptidase [Planctomycetota bacterium]
MFWAGLVVVVGATIFDLRTREIPDLFPAALLLLAALACASGRTGVGWVSAGIGLALALVLGLALFRTGGFGGGDVKLLIGLGALLGAKAFFLSLLYIGLAGGVLSVIALIRGQRELAYGPAIALGFFVFLLLNPDAGHAATT